MYAMLLLLLTGQAPAPLHALADPDEAVRLKAAVEWAKKHKPQLTLNRARQATGCFELLPPRETGCERAATLCPVREGDDGASGTRIELFSLYAKGFEHSPVRLWWSAGYEPAVAECDPPEHLLVQETEEQRRAEVAAWRKGHPAQYRACLARVKKKAKNDAEEAACELVLLNLCHAEAYLTCKTKNLRKSVEALEHVHRVKLQ